MKVYVTINNITGTVALWAIRQNHYGKLPRKLVLLLTNLNDKIEADTNVPRVAKMLEFETPLLFREWLEKKLFSIAEFNELNLCNVEYQAGLRAKDVDDNNKRMVKFGTQFDPPEYDFIDLHALLRNVVNDIVRDCEETYKLMA